MPENGPQDLEVSHGQSKVRIRGSDWLSLFGVAVGVLVLYMLFEHKTDAQAGGKDLVMVVREMTAAQMKGVEAQREMNCLISLPQERREKEADFCKRISR